MTLLAIDPGNEKSAWCVLQDGVPVEFAKEPNEDLRRRLRLREFKCGLATSGEYTDLIMEMMAPRGMPTSAEEMRALWWAGRLVESWCHLSGTSHEVTRLAVKIHICGRANAKDSNIRQALIDKFGGNSVAIGGKKCRKCKGKGWAGRGRPTCDECDGTKWEHPPGPLYGIAADVWAALGVGITYLETHVSS